ncbi:MAG TPA: GDP-mannose 4,6-dehydratase [Candidatus Nanoarchaeia archaeon]|nr:GDP-mannose 4,6-dehydratase [Candidatus Nanoarchaeia archaeon]
MTWLVTGIDGLSGQHFWQLIKQETKTTKEQFFGTSRQKHNENIFQLDLTNEKEIKNIIKTTRPTKLVLCAGLSSLRDSFTHPELYIKVNYLSTKYFIDAIKENNLNTKVLMLSSAMVYCPSEKKLKETNKTCNLSPYAETKLLQEQLIKTYPNAIVARSFNFTGPTQKDTFIVPKIAKAFAGAKENSVTLPLGDTSSVRDFLHVKDACAAYKTLIEKGSNEIYNVCSGNGRKIQEIIDILEQHTGKKAILKKMDSFKNERPVIIGDNTKLKKLGWKQSIDFKDTVIEAYEWWKGNQ